MSQITNLSSGGPTPPGSLNTFHAYITTDHLGVTGDGTVYGVIYDGLSWNVGDEYDPDTGIWTPTVDAYYQVSYGTYIGGVAADNDYFQVYFNDTGFIGWGAGDIFNPYLMGAQESLRVTTSFLMKIATPSTFNIFIEVGGSATNNINLISTSTFNTTYFSAIRLQ